MTLGTLKPPPASQAQPDAGGPVPQVRADLLTAIHAAHRGSARNKQTAIGPSQIGHPCGRHIAYMAAGRDRTQRFTDPWPSILGTAGHAWLDIALQKANDDARRPMPGVQACAAPAATHGQHNSRDMITCDYCRVQLWTSPTWITEARVDVGLGLSGSLDAFHVPAGCVVDFKILGNTKFDELRKTPPESNYWTLGDGRTYRTQIQAYGTGAVNRGHLVSSVALAIFGRAKRLDQMFMVAWDYDPAVAQWALARLESARLLAAAGVDPLAIEPTPSEGGCFYCPFKGSERDGLCEKGRN